MEAVEPVEVFSEDSARFRYRVPVGLLRELPYEGSRYSSEFEVGDCMWRFHMQERVADGEKFLALHLQSCTSSPVQAHFKLSVICMRDPLLSRSKTFHCTFKKAGSAWGLHQFIPMHQLLSAESGFIYTVEETGTRCVDFEVTLQVQRGGARPGASAQRSVTRSVSASRPPYFARDSSPRGAVSGQRPHIPGYGSGGALVSMNGDGPIDRRSASVTSVALGNRGTSAGRVDPGGAVTRRVVLRQEPRAADEIIIESGEAPVVRAPLVYPFEQLEALCDMSFDVQGVRVKAHRCVIGARMRPLLPEQMLPLQVGCIVAIAVPLDVFTTFLRYIYTEEYPEAGVLPAESLLDLYLLSAACEFFDLSAACIRAVVPLLTPDNILPIVLTRYNAADEVLTAVYLRVLLDFYDILIQDKQFEEIPGHLFRRLSLILCRRESVPNVTIPTTKNSLGKQLAWLADTGEYGDCEWVVGPQQYVIRVHMYIMACRSLTFAQAARTHPSTPLPSFTGPEFDFSLRTLQKFLMGVYRRHLDTARDFSAEDIAIVFKMQTVLGMDGHLKREADEAFSRANALRLLIYAVKHQIPELHERAIAYVARNFHEMIRSDPQAWDLISELPQSAVVSLFRTVTENNS